MRSWPVIPAMGVAVAGAALGLKLAATGAADPVRVVAAGACGAAITAAIRALVGDSPASLTGAIVAPLLVVATLFDPALADAATARAWIAVAAFAWTLVELSRPTTSPLVALLPAWVASALDPAFVVLAPIAGARLMTAPWQRPRWAIAAPIAGGLAVVLAVLACAATTGSLAALGDAWCGAPRSPVAPRALAALAATTLGPLTAVAALGGLATLARVRHAELAAAASVVAAALVGLRTGAIGPALVGLAALSAGLGLARFAATIRLSAGQAFAGATAALLLVTPPAWTAVERSIARHASR